MTGLGPEVAAVALTIALAVLVWPAPPVSAPGGRGWSRSVGLRERWRQRRVPRVLGARVDRELPIVLSATAAALRAGLGVSAALAVAAEHALTPVRAGANPIDHARRFDHIRPEGTDGDTDGDTGGTGGTDSTGGEADPWAGLIASARAGEALTPGWRSLAERCGSEEVDLVAGAWELTETGGTPLIEALAALSTLLEQRARHRRAVEIARAGPRASTRVLLLLPLAGPVAAIALGIDPVQMYLGNPVSVASVLFGGGFAALGAGWTRRLLSDRLR